MGIGLDINIYIIFFVVYLMGESLDEGDVLLGAIREDVVFHLSSMDHSGVRKDFGKIAEGEIKICLNAMGASLNPKDANFFQNMISEIPSGAYGGTPLKTLIEETIFYDLSGVAGYLHSF